MKATRKILLVSILSAVVFMTLFAGNCRPDYHVRVLNHNIEQVDSFLAELDPASYNFGEDWTFGIILYKVWADDGWTHTDGANLKIRTTNAQTLEFSFEDINRNQEKVWDRLDPGDLVAFTSSPLLLDPKKLGYGIHVIKKGTDTKFTETISDSVSIP